MFQQQIPQIPLYKSYPHTVVELSQKRTKWMEQLLRALGQQYSQLQLLRLLVQWTTLEKKNNTDMISKSIMYASQIIHKVKISLLTCKYCYKNYQQQPIYLEDNNYQSKLVKELKVLAPLFGKKRKFEERNRISPFLKKWKKNAHLK